MRRSRHSPRPDRTSPVVSTGTLWNRLALGAALITPPLLIILLLIGVSGGSALHDGIARMSVVGPIVVFMERALVTLYFPFFPGDVDPVFALLGLYILFGIVLLYRRRRWQAALVFGAPLICAWILGGAL